MAGDTVSGFTCEGSCRLPHVRPFRSGSELHERAHNHGPIAHVIILHRGEGYSLKCRQEEADQTRMIGEVGRDRAAKQMVPTPRASITGADAGRLISTFKHDTFSRFHR